jgi:hypothetical protein
MHTFYSRVSYADIIHSKRSWNMYTTLIVVLYYKIKNSSFPMLSDILTDTDFRESRGMLRELANNTEKEFRAKASNICMPKIAPPA